MTGGKKIDIKFPIREFNMRDIRSDSVCVYIAKRNSGKSTLIKDTLFHHMDIPIGTVISESEEENKFFGNFVPSMFIHYKYSSDLMENVIARQKKIIRAAKNTGEDIDARAFLIMDDCLADKTAWVRDTNIRRIFMNGRHLKLFYLLTMQYPLGIPPDLRTQIDWVFLLRDNNRQNIERFYKYYAGFFPNQQIFEQVYYKLTENYGCMVINNTTRSSRIEDCVFWYRAKVRDDFRMCCDEFWTCSTQPDETDTEDAADPIDINDVHAVNPRNKFKVIVAPQRGGSAFL